MALKFIVCPDEAPYRTGRPARFAFLDQMEVGEVVQLPHGSVTTDITPSIAYRRKARGWDRVFRTQTIEGRVNVKRIT